MASGKSSMIRMVHSSIGIRVLDGPGTGIGKDDGEQDPMQPYEPLADGAYVECNAKVPS